MSLGIEAIGLIGLLLAKVKWIVEIIQGLASGKVTEDEARAECIKAGITLSETASDAELAEYNKILEASDR